MPVVVNGVKQLQKAMKDVDADLKSAAREGVPVRFRLEAPSFILSIITIEKYH